MASRYPKIINNSPYRGDDLKRFVNAGVRARGAEFKVVSVTFYESPAHHTTGKCYGPDFNTIGIIIPRGFASTTTDLEELGQALAHELDHALGLDHKDMPDWWTLDVPWAKSLKVRRRVDKKLSRKRQALERKIRGLTMDLLDAD